MVGSRDLFEDTIRPAETLLRVYCLLENDEIQTKGEMLNAVRGAVGGSEEEECLLIQNAIFVGLVRESADMPLSALRKKTLANLLRQAIVASCTALETFLPALLRAHLPGVIKQKGRRFLPDDDEITDYFKELTFDLSTTLRLITDEEDPFFFITNKILGITAFKYLGGAKGVHAVGGLLQLEDTWGAISRKLNRDKAELKKSLNETTIRRNDIVHRADRPQREPDNDQQEIGFAWTKSSVDIIRHVCLALDELVSERIDEISRPAVKPWFDGGEIMTRLNLPAGPDVGSAVQFITNLQESEPSLTEEQAGERLDAWWAEVLQANNGKP